MPAADFLPLFVVDAKDFRNQDGSLRRSPLIGGTKAKIQRCSMLKIKLSRPAPRQRPIQPHRPAKVPTANAAISAEVQGELTKLRQRVRDLEITVTALAVLVLDRNDLVVRQRKTRAVVRSEQLVLSFLCPAAARLRELDSSVRAE